MVDVLGYDGLYTVNEIGEVYQTKKTIRRMPGLVKPQRTKQGYLQVQLVRGWDRKFFYVHRLVAVAFIPNPNNRPHINHINGIKGDNRVENLEWCSPTENVIHSHINGLKPRKIPTDQVQVIINRRYAGETIGELARHYGVSYAYISSICTGRRGSKFRKAA